MSPVDHLNALVRGAPAWPCYILFMLPAVWYFWLGLSGGLGAEPIRALEQALGKVGLQLLIAALAISPLRRFAGINLLKFRRAVALAAFYTICLHLAVWLLLDLQDWGRVWADIVKRPYITIGMAGFALMVPLALTSNNWSVRRLGPRWRALHRLFFPAVLLGAVHFVMLAKGWQREPLVYLALVLGLLVVRSVGASRRRAAG